ncbi:MAG: phosphatidate cytidylyltransferase, partial [Comamonas sp.]|nr:phosphatidate cytidylyltransferase [Comamonas sp.]
MLKQRVITAVVLLAILLPALLADNPVFFHAIVLLMVAAGAWEWGRLNGLGTVAALGSGALGLAAGLLTYFMGGLQADCKLLWLVAGLAWVVAGVVLLRLGVAG